MRWTKGSVMVPLRMQRMESLGPGQACCFVRLCCEWGQGGRGLDWVGRHRSCQGEGQGQKWQRQSCWLQVEVVASGEK